MEKERLIIGDRRSNSNTSTTESFGISEVSALISRYRFLLASLTCIAIAVAFFEHKFFPIYKASATISIQSAENNFSQALSARLGGLFAKESLDREAIDRYMQYMNSSEFFISAAVALKATEEFEQVKKYFIYDDAIDHLLKRHAHDEISDDLIARRLASWVSYGKNGQFLIDIFVKTPDAVFTAKLANLIAQTAVDFLMGNEFQELDEAEHYLKEQLTHSENEIRGTDKTIVDFKKSNKLISINKDGAEVSSRIIDLKRNLEEVNIDIEQTDRIINDLQKDLRKQRQEFFASNNEIEESRPKYGVARKIEELKKEHKYLVGKRNTLQKLIDEVLNSQNPNLEQRVYDLRKKLELEYSLYHELKKQQFNVDIQRIFAKSRIQFFERAHIEDTRRNISLDKKVFFSIFIALLLGAGGAYIWELVLPRVRSKEDLTNMRTKFLGGIPDINIAPKRFNFIKKIIKRDRDALQAVAFRHIRMRIFQIPESVGERNKIIAIVSPKVGDGKTFCSINIASSLANGKKKTLLVDFDIRKMNVSNHFHLAKNKGLCEALIGAAKLDDLIVPNVLPMLDVLPSGFITEEIAETLPEVRFNEIINALADKYDHIVIDTPPLLVVPDSALAVQVADLAVLVVSWNNTSKENLASAVEVLNHYKPRKIYSIMNKDHASNSHFNRKNYYYYGYFNQRAVENEKFV